jgi:hypothetical protein
VSGSANITLADIGLKIQKKINKEDTQNITSASIFCTVSDSVDVTLTNTGLEILKNEET